MHSKHNLPFVVGLVNPTYVLDLCQALNASRHKKEKTMNTQGGASIFSGIYSGLTNTYALLANAYPGGVTPSNIASARSNPNLMNSLNPSFASYIQTNFASLDADRDGVLSPAELSSLTTKITTQGLTSAQLAQLGTATGLSGNALEQVLEHFNEMDTNKDGKVTMAEISAYKITSAAEKKKAEFTNKAAANMSVFYGSEDSSTAAADSSSLLAYRYLNDDTNNP